MPRLLCAVYRSTRHPEMYLYVPKGAEFQALPDALRQLFGRPVPVMELLLEPARRLARADAATVLAQIDEQGFYLQMPPDPLGTTTGRAGHA